MPGEFDFIQWIRSQTSGNPRIVVGPGDDLAALRFDGSALLLAGADQVLDGVHFDAAIHPPRLVGRKAMNRNLSDCAAMACKPIAAVATVALPKEAGIEYAKELFLGLKEAGDAFDCPVVGGDTATWGGRLALSVTILGAAPAEQVRRRSSARPGQGIYVTGALGGSIRGRHMTFVPRVHEGLELGKVETVGAMIDLSDGLSRDLGHICRESGVGAILRADAIPIHDDATLPGSSRTPLQRALHDGEDYELLFTATVPTADTRYSAIGITTSEPGIFIEYANGRREPLSPDGWEHRI